MTAEHDLDPLVRDVLVRVMPTTAQSAAVKGMLNAGEQLDALDTVLDMASERGLTVPAVVADRCRALVSDLDDSRTWLVDDVLQALDAVAA